MSYEEQMAIIRQIQLVDPPRPPSGRLPIQNLDEYRTQYAEALEGQPEYWAHVASQFAWFSPWASVLEETLPDVQGFRGAL